MEDMPAPVVDKADDEEKKEEVEEEGLFEELPMKDESEDDSDSSSVSSRSSATVDVEFLQTWVRWVTPKGKEGKIHICPFLDEEREDPTIEAGACGWGMEDAIQGTGRSQAEILGRQWCGTCMKLVDPELRVALRKPCRVNAYTNMSLVSISISVPACKSLLSSPGCLILIFVVFIVFIVFH